MRGSRSLPGTFCPHLFFTCASKSGCSNWGCVPLRDFPEAGAWACGMGHLGSAPSSPPLWASQEAPTVGWLVLPFAPRLPQSDLHLATLLTDTTQNQWFPGFRFHLRGCYSSKSL